MKTVIRKAYIIPMTGEGDSFYGDICIDGQKIEYVGPEAPASCYPAEVIDGRGHAVLPSFVNAHTHIGMQMLRNYRDTQHDLMDWLKAVWAVEDKLTERDIHDASLLGCAELIKCGCTAYSDMYFFQTQTAAATVEAGIRGSLGLTLFGDLDETRRRTTERWAQMKKWEGREGLITLTVAPHAVYTVSEDSLKYGIDFAHDNGIILNAHLSETRGEVEDCLRDHGATPAMYLDRLGFFDGRSSVAHCVHLTGDEVEMMASKSHTPHIVHCPASNAKLGSGIAPVAKFVEKGLRVALGTDSASSNNNLNMMKEMNLAALLASATTGDTTAVTPYQALRMATYEGACALGLEGEIGTLEAGKKADLIMVRLDSTNNCPVNNVYSALVYSASSEDVRNVFCNGEMLMKNRTLLTINERKVRSTVRRDWKEVQER